MSKLTRKEVEDFFMMAGEALGQQVFADALAADWLRLHAIVSGQLLDVGKRYATVAQHARDYEQVKAERDALLTEVSRIRDAAGRVVRLARNVGREWRFATAIDELRTALAAGNQER